ncbi:hypothetical protein AMTRI_Chr09g18400 [Amborella trichopoda]
MKEEPFRWTKEAAQEIRQLKAKVQTLAPLAPVHGGSFILSTNASSNTWVAILLKKENIEENICAYTNGQLKMHDRTIGS